MIASSRKMRLVKRIRHMKSCRAYHIRTWAAERNVALRNLVGVLAAVDVVGARRYDVACNSLLSVSCLGAGPLQSADEIYQRTAHMYLKAPSLQISAHRWVKRKRTKKMRLTKVDHGIILFQIILHRCASKDNTTTSANPVQGACDATLGIFTAR